MKLLTFHKRHSFLAVDSMLALTTHIALTGVLAPALALPSAASQHLTLPPQLNTTAPANSGLDLESSLGTLSRSISVSSFSADAPLTASSELPEDPFIFTTPDIPDFTMKFENYTEDLITDECALCMMGLQRDIGRHGPTDTVAPESPRLNYKVGEAYLTIHPETCMTWSDVNTVSAILRTWLMSYRSVALDFDIYLLGGRHLGSGAWTKLKDPPGDNN